MVVASTGKLIWRCLCRDVVEPTDAPATETWDDARARPRYDVMSLVSGGIGVAFVVAALLHIPHPTPFIWIPYACAAVLSFITLKPALSMPIARLLAVCSTVLMFYFFALFFFLVPKLATDWYADLHQSGLVLCLLGSAFVMIPILSCYSCHLKADCIESRRKKRHAFFSVPSHIRRES